MKKTVLCSALLAAFYLAGTAQAAPAQAVPSFTQEAEELARLPGGGWLLLDKHGLRLFDAAGQEQDRIAVRAKQLDTRSDGGKVLAVFLEADTQRPLPVSVDVQAGKLVKLAPFPVPTFSVEASCLYRDAQQPAHLVLIGKDGHAEQWVMQGGQRLLVRRLALPPHAKHCRADEIWACGRMTPNPKAWASAKWWPCASRTASWTAAPARWPCCPVAWPCSTARRTSCICTPIRAGNGRRSQPKPWP
ncbi:hypothetical protein [Janthinobacterium sp.]|uniref:hypothetical protein n=1 Tax=Janthinobacterium sp. TaxID=1871054 RepID=UPI00258963BC|nr:hypothetical protein [Janthinobacterium sp.]MCX7290559.1 hypothetical protein [Janthinobacterium sp.]